MAVIALVSAKGSPGVSVTALALALSWPGRTILAECDPAGGDALPGFLGGQVTMSGGIAELPVSAARGRLEAGFWGQLVDLDAPKRERLLLPGVREPAESGGVASIGERIASFFADAERGDPEYDVIADCGRLTAPNTPWPVLGRADVVILLVRGTMPSLAHAHAAVAELRSRFETEGWRTDGIVLAVVDDGPYVGEAGRYLNLPVVGVLPNDPRTARTLSLGGQVRRGDKLIRAAGELTSPLRKLIAGRRTGGHRIEVSNAR